MAEERFDVLELAAVMDQADGRLGGVGAGDLLGDQSVEERADGLASDTDGGNGGPRFG